MVMVLFEPYGDVEVHTDMSVQVLAPKSEYRASGAHPVGYFTELSEDAWVSVHSIYQAI
jgi:hypothetical protein